MNDKLEELCKPIMEYLKKQYNPYTEISITIDAVTVKQIIQGIPNKIGDQPED